MDILKKVLVVVLVLASIPFLLAIFIRKNYAVEREVIVNKPVQEVFNYIKYLKNQDRYSKWAMMDPNMKKTYQGEDGTVGFVSAWKSENKDVGIGEQEIKRIIEGERIDFELRFIKPFESTEQAYMATEALSDMETRVIWGFNGHMAYPSNLMLLFMDFEKIIGDDLQSGLDKLKNMLEVMP